MRFQISVNGLAYDKLKRLAEDYGITLQELVRCRIVPEWVRENRVTEEKKLLPDNPLYPDTGESGETYDVEIKEGY